MSPEEDRTRDAVDSEPKHHQLSYSGPRAVGLFYAQPTGQRVATGVPVFESLI